MTIKSALPVYSQIALDIAHKIVRGSLKENDKFTGRSLMSAEYQASSETIRRALKLLADMNVIEIQPNSGASVISRERAVNFIAKQQTGQDIRTLKQELMLLLNERDTMNERIVELISKIIDLNEKYKNSTPLLDFEFNIPDKSPLIGQSVAALKFWQNTGATIVAIRREGNIILSPGPDAVICHGDIIVVVGNPEVWDSVNSFIYKS